MTREPLTGVCPSCGAVFWLDEGHSCSRRRLRLPRDPVSLLQLASIAGLAAGIALAVFARHHAAVPAVFSPHHVPPAGVHPGALHVAALVILAHSTATACIALWLELRDPGEAEDGNEGMAS